MRTSGILQPGKYNKANVDTHLVPAPHTPMEVVVIIVDAEEVLPPLHHQSALPYAVGSATDSASLESVLRVSCDTRPTATL